MYIGNKWAEIGKELTGRSGQQAKGRFELLKRRVMSHTGPGIFIYYMYMVLYGE